jgi:hypothetical protein
VKLRDLEQDAKGYGKNLAAQGMALPDAYAAIDLKLAVLMESLKPAEVTVLVAATMGDSVIYGIGDGWTLTEIACHCLQSHLETVAKREYRKPLSRYDTPERAAACYGQEA